MINHTKGPWKVDGKQPGLILYVLHEKGMIASLSIPRRIIDEERKPDESWIEMRARTESDRDDLKDEMAANARLMAAAPDLLEALKTVRDSIAVLNHLDSDIQNFICGTINKAEGK